MAPDDPAIAAAFLERLLTDRERGGVRPLADYQAEWPGHDALIAREYELCQPARSPRGEPSAPVAPEPGDELFTIGRYRALRELGRGGQGTVYEALDVHLGRRVALKVLASRASDDHLARFRREAAVASRLDHAGICAVYESGTDDGRAYIAMRFVDGPSLADRLAAARSTGADVLLTGADDDTLVRFFEEAARALHVAHEAGIVHRDIKPGNVLIAPDGAPVLCDFGLAREEDSTDRTLTRTGDVFGTPAYMSPEQLAGGRLDRRTDVWSLGVTLFEALTQRLPFEAPTRDGLYRRIREGPATDVRHFRPELGRDLATVLATALEHDLDRRYGTALDLALDLCRVRVREPIRARPAGPLLRLVRWSQRNPALCTALGSLFVVLTASLVLTAGFLRKAEEDKRELAALNDDLERALDDARTGRATKRERAVRAHVEAGYQALFSFPHADGDASFEAALELDPTNEAARVGLVWSAWSDPDEALARLDRFASTSFADDPDLAWIRGSLLRSAGREDEARRALATAGERDTHVRAWLRGLRAVRGFEPPTSPEEAARALAEFRIASLRAPRPQFHYVHAQMMAAELCGDRAALDDAAVRMEAHWGDSPFALEAIAQFYFALDPARAERALRRLTAVAPERVAPWLGLAQIEERRGHVELALAHLDRALELDPDVGQTWLLRGELLLGTERFDAACDDLEQAARLLPEYDAVFTSLERACRELGGAAEIARRFDSLVTEQPDARSAWRVLARARRTLGDASGELEALVAGLDPTDDVDALVRAARAGEERALVELRERVDAATAPNGE